MDTKEKKTGLMGMKEKHLSKSVPW